MRLVGVTFRYPKRPAVFGMTAAAMPDQFGAAAAMIYVRVLFLTNAIDHPRFGVDFPSSGVRFVDRAIT
jgi:hypothetical protein